MSEFFEAIEVSSLVAAIGILMKHGPFLNQFEREMNNSDKYREHGICEILIKIFTDFKSESQDDMWRDNIKLLLYQLQFNKIDVFNPMEILIHIFNTIHESFEYKAQKGKQYSDVQSIKSNQLCISCTCFKLPIIENYACKCGVTYNLPWNSYCQYIKASRVLSHFDYNEPEIRLGSLSNSQQSSTIKNTENIERLIPIIRRRFKGFQSLECSSKKCDIKNSKYDFSVERSPNCFIINLIWPQCNVTCLDAYYSTLSLTSNFMLKHLYHDNTERAFYLTAIVFKNKNSYEYAYSNGSYWLLRSQYLLWEDILKKVIVTKMHPIIIMYEADVNDSSIKTNLSMIIDLENKACEEDLRNICGISEGGNRRDPQDLQIKLSQQIILKNHYYSSINWMCNCFYINSETNSLCQKCNTSRLSLGGWYCMQCKLYNKIFNSTKCVACKCYRFDNPLPYGKWWMCQSCSTKNSEIASECRNCKNTYQSPSIIIKNTSLDLKEKNKSDSFATSNTKINEIFINTSQPFLDYNQKILINKDKFIKQDTGEHPEAFFSDNKINNKEENFVYNYFIPDSECVNKEAKCIYCEQYLNRLGECMSCKSSRNIESKICTNCSKNLGYKFCRSCRSYEIKEDLCLNCHLSIQDYAICNECANPS